MSEFSFGVLSAPLREALEHVGYTTPTPIQAEAIPHLLARRDVLGCAQTGTGKTAAFVLPILERLIESGRGRGKRVPKALILTPTRELAVQIDDNIRDFAARTDIRSVVIMGGVNAGPQIRALRTGSDIIVATPGRLLDLHSQGAVDLSWIEFFVLDEADRMLDMGFINDIRRVLSHLPDRRQNLLFSATMAKEIVELAGDFMSRPIEVSITPSATTVERIEQAVCFAEKNEKKDALVAALNRDDVERAIVFTRTKHGANKLVRMLLNTNIEAAAIHGNKSQSARQRTLDDFKHGHLRVLVATDVASRGIDIDDVTHVYIFDLPDEPEVYVHRVGRTGRAGKEGVALSFCAADERDKLDAIMRVTQEPMQVVDFEGVEQDILQVPQKQKRGGRNKGGGRKNASQARNRRRSNNRNNNSDRAPRRAPATDGSPTQTPAPATQRADKTQESSRTQGEAPAKPRKSRRPRNRKPTGGGQGRGDREEASKGGESRGKSTQKKRSARPSATSSAPNAPRAPGASRTSSSPPQTSFRRTKTTKPS